MDSLPRGTGDGGGGLKPMKQFDVTEKVFEAQVKQLARMFGWMWYHTFNAYRSAKGFPDCVLCHPEQSRIIFAELKSEKGKLMPDQEVWLESLRQTGLVEVYLWRPSDFDQIAEILKSRKGACYRLERQNEQDGL